MFIITRTVVSELDVGNMCTLPQTCQKKRNFSESIFPADPGSGSVIQGHEHYEEWGILQVVTRSITKIKIHHMITDLQSPPKEMQLSKSCISFEEECSWNLKL